MARCRGSDGVGKVLERSPATAGREYHAPVIKRPVEGTVSIEDSSGLPIEGRWYLENGVVTLYVGDFGPFATLVGGQTPESIARHLMGEFLDGRQAQESKISSIASVHACMA